MIPQPQAAATCPFDNPVLVIFSFLQFHYRINFTLTVVSAFGLVGNLMSFIVLIWKLRPRVSQSLFLDRLKLFSHTNEGIGTLDKTGIWRRGGGKPPTSLRKQYFEPYLRRSTIGASFVRTCVPWRRRLSFYFKTSCWTLPPSLSLLLLLLLLHP